MAQYIQVSEVGEADQTLRASNINFATVNKALTKLPEYKKKFPWLSTIDEYGNTTFNYLQLPYVVTELEELKKQIKSEEVYGQIDLFREFAEGISNHQYVKFMGD